jgi:hypothetical protein
MALIARSRILNRFPSLWVDPDTTKNRVFIDTYAYDLTTLAPRSNEQFMWQNRANTNINSDTVSYDPFTPINTGYMDGNCWANANNAEAPLPGIFDLWTVSLDYETTKPTRVWKTQQNRILCTYPRTADANHYYGDWWMGFDMSKKSMAYATQRTQAYVHLFEQIESRNFNATSWSYSGTTITVNSTAHGLYYGDKVVISGAVMTSGTNAPNGEWVITQATDANSFQFTVGQAPTGTAAGTMNVISTTRRSWGFRHVASRAAYSSCGMGFDMIQGYDYLTQDNNSTTYTYFKNTAALSAPFALQETVEGGWKFYIGNDSTNTYAWLVHVNTASTGVAGQTGASAYKVTRYLLTQAQGTATTILAATNPTSPLTDRIIQCPSNLRKDSATRKVFYSSHYNTTQQAPMRFVVNTEGGTCVATQCVLTYPAGTTYSTYAALPTANSYTAFGYNVWWSKPHQFQIGGIRYITFCTLDKYYWANTARFPTRLSRTWLTFTIGDTDATDQNMTFHSAITFESASDFPLSWMPYTQNGQKLVICSTTNTSVWTFIPRSAVADGWSYATSGSVSKVTVTEANHGYNVGDRITISGATATSNAPNGTYQIVTVPSANTFTFNTDINNTGVITGTAGGTLTISSGWQTTFSSGIRARGFGVDSLGRLWVGAAASGFGNTEIHLLKENTPYKVTVNFQNPIASNTNTFEYLGSATNTNILVSAYDISGNRIVTKLKLTIKSNNLTFAGNLKELNIITSATGDTSTPVTVTGPGQALISSTTVA